MQAKVTSDNKASAQTNTRHSLMPSLSNICGYRHLAQKPFTPVRQHRSHVSVAATTVDGQNSSSQKPSILSVRDLSFHPAGAPEPLLNNINMEVPPNSLGLIIGRSGSGKTTLLQILAGLSDQTSGTVHLGDPTLHTAAASAASRAAQQRNSSGTGNTATAGSDGAAGAAAAASASASRGSKFAARMASENRQVRPVAPANNNSSSSSASSPSAAGSALHQLSAAVAPTSDMEDRMKHVGLVFQFPERHFLGSDVYSELTFTWPASSPILEQQVYMARVRGVLQAVRLSDIEMRRAPWELSGGQQRRLALAVQLIRQPAVLLLDEPLAGLDWQARLEVIDLLARLKKMCSLVVVSHDLREVSPLVDCAWTMRMGGYMESLDTWPPPGGIESYQRRPGTPQPQPPQLVTGSR